MSALTPRLRFLVVTTARLALVVVMLQIAALDHHFGVSDVVGVEGSSAHSMHCHGDASGCADAGSGAVLAAGDAFGLPLEATRPLAIESASVRPLTIHPQAEPEPPRL